MQTLRELREAQHLSAIQVAEQMGVTFSTVYFWERGERAISAYDLERLMAFYGADAAISETSTLMPRNKKNN